jgi:hypothetical protein
MTRSVTTTILAAFVLMGTAWGQEREPKGAPEVLPLPVQTVPAAPPPSDSEPIPPAPPPATAGGHESALWGSVSYLASWQRGDTIPVLVTTSPPGTPRNRAGVIGSPGTMGLYGGTGMNTEVRSGFDIELGYWFDPEHRWGIQADFFVLEGQSSPFFATSSGTPILARPYTNVNTGNKTASIAAFPGFASGSIGANDAAKQFWSTSIDLRENFCRCDWCRFDSLLGYRFLTFGDHLTVQQTVHPLVAPFVPGSQILSTDSFTAKNLLQGVDLGIQGTFFWNDFTLDVMGKVLGGQLARTVEIAGDQVTMVPGFPPVTRVGGLLALSSNIGNYNRHVWTAAPEVGLILSWQVNSYTRLRLGYDVLMIPNVVRAGQQVSTFINPALIPPGHSSNTTNPMPLSATTQDYLIQNLTLGVEFCY